MLKNSRLLSVAFGGALGVVVAWTYGKDFLQWLYNLVTQRTATDSFPTNNNPALVATAMLGLVVGATLGTLIHHGLSRIAEGWRDITMGDKVTLMLGTLAGIIGSIPFLFFFQTLKNFNAPAATAGLLIAVTALAIYALRSIKDILPWHRDDRPTKRTGIKVFDTSVIIDGRIYDIAQAGFLEGELYVPKFVIEELQHIADSSDALRRQRGRRGLDVLRLLQEKFELEVGTKDKFAPDRKEEVDSRLVRLAKAIGADLITNDMNLNQVARLQDVRVLNVNDLAMALKPNVLPKESLEVSIIKEGSQHNQGVAYLDDGTMVVVENGRNLVGETREVIVTQVIQTERGKMIFAEAPGVAYDIDPDRTTRRNTGRRSDRP